MPLMTSASQIKGVAQSSQPATTPEGNLWYDTSNNLLKATDGSTFSTIGRSSFAGAAVVSHSTTIGDYTTPTAAVSSSPSNDFEDVYSSNTGWTQVGTLLDVDNLVTDKVGGTVVAGNGEHRVHKALGITLSDTLWISEFDFILTNEGTNVELLPFLLAAGTGIPYSATQDYCGFDIYEASGIYNARVHCRDGASNTYGTVIPISLATQYYMRLERTTATNLRLSIFSDAARTTNITSSPQNVTIPATVASLTHLHHSSWSTAAVGTSNFAVDNTKIRSGSSTIGLTSAANVYDNDTATEYASNSENNTNIYVDMGSALNLCAIAIYWDNTSTETEIKLQSSADAVTWTDKRTITTSNLTNGAYNYYRFNIAGAARYIRIYGTGTSKTLKIWEIKVLKKTDAEIFADLGILEISSSDTTLDGDAL